MFLFFLLQRVDRVLKKYLYSCQLCNFLRKKQDIIKTIMENMSLYKYTFAEINVTLLFFMFWRVEEAKAIYYEKKLAI